MIRFMPVAIGAVAVVTGVLAAITGAWSGSRLAAVAGLSAASGATAFFLYAVWVVFAS